MIFRKFAFLRSESEFVKFLFGGTEALILGRSLALFSNIATLAYKNLKRQALTMGLLSWFRDVGRSYGRAIGVKNIRQTRSDSIILDFR